MNLAAVGRGAGKRAAATRPPDLRRAPRRPVRLQSAKLFDATGAFICHAAIRDLSATGLRIVIDMDCELPHSFGVYIDLAERCVTVATAWRRERMLGLRILREGSPSKLKASALSAFRSRYYGMRL